MAAGTISLASSTIHHGRRHLISQERPQASVPSNGHPKLVQVRAGLRRGDGGLSRGQILKHVDALSTKTNMLHKKASRLSGKKEFLTVTSQVGTTGMETPPVVKESSVDGGGDSVHKVVIVGAGIAGLSAALALHRVGVKVLVLEQSSSVRTTGQSLSLWTNAWRALDHLGVADGLRAKHTLISKAAMFDKNEKLLKEFDLDESPGGPHEVRAVERKLLVDSLAEQLPPGSIQFNGRVRAVEREPHEGFTKVYLENGSVVSAKVLVGCDGVNSVVGQWMGLPPPRYVGQVAIRGVAVFPKGHDFGTRIFQLLGASKRCGIVPYSETKVYWFVCYNRGSQGPKVTDPNAVKAEALKVIEGWPDRMQQLVHNTPLENLSRAALSDRWNIPGITPPLVKEGVTVAGDAMHPMTPNIGQGGCSAIEDAIVLARSLAEALSGGEGADVADSIQKSLEAYAAQRQERTLPLSIKSYVFGVLLSIGFAPVVFLRDNLIMPKLVSAQSFLSHTLYDVGGLPNTKVTAE